MGTASAYMKRENRLESGILLSWICGKNDDPRNGVGFVFIENARPGGKCYPYEPEIAYAALVDGDVAPSHHPSQELARRAMLNRFRRSMKAKACFASMPAR